MKPVIAIAAAGLMSAAVAATPAAAYHLSPSGNFTAEGTTTATAAAGGITLPCNAQFTGSVNSKGIGSITGGTFTTSTGLPGACEQITLTGLPWKSVAKSAKKVVIQNAAFTGPLGISCGPSNVPVTLRHGVIKFTAVPMAGGCSIDGNLTVAPKLKIVP